VAPIFGPRYVAKLVRSTAATTCAWLLAIFRKLTATWHTRVLLGRGFDSLGERFEKQGGRGGAWVLVARTSLSQVAGTAFPRNEGNGRFGRLARYRGRTLQRRAERVSILWMQRCEGCGKRIADRL